MTVGMVYLLSMTLHMRSITRPNSLENRGTGSHAPFMHGRRRAVRYRLRLSCDMSSLLIAMSYS